MHKSTTSPTPGTTPTPTPASASQAGAQTQPRCASLDSTTAWQLRYIDESSGAPATPTAMRDLPGDGLTAHVPGNVELDLSRAGVLPDDLFWSTNILQTVDYEGHQWWYERRFASPPWHPDSATSLVFAGLDCFATVWVNDQQVGQAANALIPHRFDITATLKPAGRSNRLTVRLASPINAVKDRPVDANAGAHLFQADMLWARKPPHAYGWDIMPRAVSAGIWRSVTLEEQRPTELEEVYLDTLEIGDDKASVRAHVTFRTELPPRGFTVRIDGQCGEHNLHIEQPLSTTRGSLRFVVENPQLWWPRGYGQANIYDLKIQLLHRGRVVSQRPGQLGIRTVTLERTDLHRHDRPGRFVFRVNGQRIFCRGSNWVPADAFHSRDAARIARSLELFTDLQCNIVRCWGGNVYEDHAFYDICDRRGLMVWQDFTMACAAYPQHPDFLAMIGVEAEAVVKKLRQHPSIVLWCGDNECDASRAEGWHTRKQNPDHNRLTREVIAQVIHRHDPGREYLPSSPYIPEAAYRLGDPQYVIPEQHVWGERGYFKADFYANNTAIFASEMGYHGCPNIASIKRFIPADKLWPCQPNEDWDLHSTSPVPGFVLQQRVELMRKQIREFFGTIPDGLDCFAVASQIVQAEAKKFFVELFRQRKWNTTGIIWWNMIDGWPQFSDAIVDYYYQKKLAYHYLKRIHAPLALIVGEESEAGLAVFAVNDSRNPRRGQVRIRDAESGQAVLQARFHVGPNDRSVVAVMPAPGEGQRLYLIEWQCAGQAGASHYLYGRPPFDFARYRDVWLPRIAALDDSFDAGLVGA